MLYVSILTSDRSQDPELWATIWQGQAQPSINLISAYNMGNDKRVFIWEGEVLADIQFMDRFNEVGVLETSPAFDRSAGWLAAFAKDIETFEQGLRRTGREYPEAAVDLRTRGMNAPNRHAARAAARAWTEEQENK